MNPAHFYDLSYTYYSSFIWANYIQRLSIDYSTFEDNRVLMPLGTLINLPVIYIQGFSDQIFINGSEFNYNMGTTGGALSILASGATTTNSSTEHIHIIGSNFKYNLATTAGGAVYIKADSSPVNVLIENCNFDFNVGFSQTQGSAVYYEYLNTLISSDLIYHTTI